MSLAKAVGVIEDEVEDDLELGLATPRGR